MWESRVGSYHDTPLVIQTHIEKNGLGLRVAGDPGQGNFLKF